MVFLLSVSRLLLSMVLRISTVCQFAALYFVPPPLFFHFIFTEKRLSAAFTLRGFPGGSEFGMGGVQCVLVLYGLGRKRRRRETDGMLSRQCFFWSGFSQTRTLSLRLGARASFEQVTVFVSWGAWQYAPFC